MKSQKKWPSTQVTLASLKKLEDDFFCEMLIIITFILLRYRSTFSRAAFQVAVNKIECESKKQTESKWNGLKLAGKKVGKWVGRRDFKVGELDEEKNV